MNQSRHWEICVIWERNSRRKFLTTFQQFQNNRNENCQTPKDKLRSKKNLHSTDVYPLGPNLIPYPDLRFLHKTDVIVAWCSTAYLQVKALRSAEFLAGRFPLPYRHLPIKKDWRPLRLLRRKLLGRVRPRGFGKWSLNVVTVEDKIVRWSETVCTKVYNVFGNFCILVRREVSLTSRVIFVPN